MKTINAQMDDSEYIQIHEIKNSSGLNWANFILEAAKAYQQLNGRGE